MRPPLLPPEQNSWQMDDGYVIRGRVWNAGQHAQRTIVYLHGIQSHGGWFEWSASVLAQSGAAVVLPDRRGSGLNAESRGDVPNVERWLADARAIGAWARAEFRTPAVDVVGVSWGGKIACQWALEHASEIRRVLLVCPGVFPAVDVGLRARMAIGRALLVNPTRQFEIPLSDPALFTDNPAGQAFIEQDPLKLTTASARFLWLSRKIDRRLARMDRESLTAEVTLLLAGRERIIRNAPTEAWLRRICGQPPRVELFSDDAHTLEFAADVGRLRDTLESW